MPMTKLGRWGLSLICVAAVLVIISMLTARFLSSSEENTAYNVLGVLAPVFIFVTIAALIFSWIAIIRDKDRGMLLVIFACLLSIITLFAFVGEVAEIILS
jgi:hypothetical protein